MRYRVRHLALLVWLTSASVSAQTRASTAEIDGHVVDGTGGALAGATIVAIATATNTPHTTTTDQAGRFVLPGLPIGTYVVTVERGGFAPQTLPPVRVAVGDRATLDVTLAIAAVTTDVSVVARDPIVDTQKSSVSTVITTDQIARLPTNGRNFIAFATLTPGVSVDRGVAAQDTSGLSFAGQRGRSNNISLDGLDNNGVNLGNVRGTISQDAVAEFQVMTASSGAEFGKASGGLVNIVSRSGTNAFSGTAFVFVRDRAMNGRSRFEVDAAGRQLPKAPFSQEQFGFAAGGPIRRDRTFVFGAFERQATVGSEFVAIDDAVIVMHPFAPVPLGTAAGILRQGGFDVETGYQRYAATTDQYFVKVDHHGTDGQWIGARMHGSTRDDDRIEPFGGLVAKSHAVTLRSHDVQAAAWWVASPSPRWLHDVRVQFARDSDRERPLDPRCGGACVADDQGGPSVTVLGAAIVGRNPNAPASSRFRYFQLLDTVSGYAGRHQWRAGVDIGVRWIPENHFPLNFGGSFVFADLSAPIAALFGLPAAVSAIQSFAIGLPVLYVQGTGVPDGGGTRNHDASFFVQDDWRVADRLTVQLGLRYQLQGFSTRAFDVPGVDGTYRFPADRNNLAPRLGLAWQPATARPTVVRASYGLFYDRTLTGLEGSAAILNPKSGVRTIVGQGALAIAAWRAPGHRLTPEQLAGLPATAIAVDPSLRTPYAHQFAVGIDRELRETVAVSASVVSVRGLAQPGVLDYNPLVPALGAGRRPGDVGGVPGTSASVLQYTSFGETWYRGLLLRLERRFSRRSQFLVSYTLAIADDNVADFTVQPSDPGRGRNPEDPTGLPLGFDPLRDRGPSPRDQRQRLTVSGVHELPRGLSVSAIVDVGSGRPFDITAGQDLNGDGAPGSDRPRTTVADPATAIGRNLGMLPAQASVDVRLTWQHRVAGRGRVEWVVETFNLLNRVNYTDVNAVFGPGPYPDNPAPGFGQFTQAGPPRQVQLAARLRF